MPYRLTLIVDFPQEPSSHARSQMVADLQEFHDAIAYLSPTIVTERLIEARSIDRQPQGAGSHRAGSIVVRGG